MSPELTNTIATIAGIVVAILGAFLFAFWVAMAIWTFNDVRARTQDWLAILLACLLVLIFPVIGLILYTLIRPKHTIAEIYDRALEEEALLREIEETNACFSCGLPVKDDWAFCPSCHAELQHACQSCVRHIRNDWDICVYCGTSQTPLLAGAVDEYVDGGAPLPPEPSPRRVEHNLGYRPVRTRD